MEVFVNPETFEVKLKPVGKEMTVISEIQQVFEITNVEVTERKVSWSVQSNGIRVIMELLKNSIEVTIQSTDEGTFKWPRLGETVEIEGFIMPRAEGAYIPQDDRNWIGYLADKGLVDTNEFLSMPFFGLDCKDYTITYLFSNPFNNTIEFQDSSNRLGFDFIHEFTTINKEKTYGFTIMIGEDNPIEPAKIYRNFLIQRGQFVTMEQKIKEVPKAERLLGAIHIYLWGSEFITPKDVTNWRKFINKITREGKQPQPSPSKHIWSLLENDAKKEMLAVSEQGYVSNYQKGVVVRSLNNIMMTAGFYNEDAWKKMDLSLEIQELLDQDLSKLKEVELYQINKSLLQVAYADVLIDMQEWGNGTSQAMLDRLQESNIDKAWLGLDDWFPGFKNPDFVKRADELGYLIGPYDSYHSIHHPDQVGWTTALFDEELYEIGGVVKEGGKMRRGFKQRGYILSPLVALPYVKERVNEIMESVEFNSWFIDCDAAGQYFEDYSPQHTATQADGVSARRERLDWIKDTYDLVIGSEGGSGLFASTIHFAHGMMTPVFGFFDPDLKERNSKYYLGSYWPPDNPSVFTKQVPLKEKYRYVYYDPRFRLPLYQTVFHDSIVTTHHWLASSLKFVEQTDMVELLELLYNVPPLYHLNLDEFAKYKEQITKHYQVFSPIHQIAGLLPMTDFQWLSEDQLVQRTVFGEEVEMVANFKEQTVSYINEEIPAKSILIIWIKENKKMIYTPAK